MKAHTRTQIDALNARRKSDPLFDKQMKAYEEAIAPAKSTLAIVESNRQRVADKVIGPLGNRPATKEQLINNAGLGSNNVIGPVSNPSFPKDEQMERQTLQSYNEFVDTIPETFTPDVLTDRQSEADRSMKGLVGDQNQIPEYAYQTYQDNRAKGYEYWQLDPQSFDVLPIYEGKPGGSIITEEEGYDTSQVWMAKENLAQWESSFFGRKPWADTNDQNLKQGMDYGLSLGVRNTLETSFGAMGDVSHRKTRSTPVMQEQKLLISSRTPENTL